jgi:hypothetical protein
MSNRTSRCVACFRRRASEARSDRFRPSSIEVIVEEGSRLVQTTRVGPFACVDLRDHRLGQVEVRPRKLGGGRRQSEGSGSDPDGRVPIIDREPEFDSPLEQRFTGEAWRWTANAGTMRTPFPDRHLGTHEKRPDMSVRSRI